MRRIHIKVRTLSSHFLFDLPGSDFGSSQLARKVDVPLSLSHCDWMGSKGSLGSPGHLFSE